MKKILFALLATAVGAAALATADTAQASGDVVTIKEAVTPGTIIVRTQERRLYYVTGAGQAISYPVGVGRISNGRERPASAASIPTQPGRRRRKSAATSPTCRM